MTAGRKPRSLTVKEVRSALQGMTRKSVAVILKALGDGDDDPGDVKVAQWVIEHVIGKATQRSEVTGKDGEAVKVDVGEALSKLMDQIAEREPDAHSDG